MNDQLLYLMHYADQLGAMQVYANGVDMSENAQALEAFRTNTHGDHFLGNAHTLENFESAFDAVSSAEVSKIRLVRVEVVEMYEAVECSDQMHARLIA